MELELDEVVALVSDPNKQRQLLEDLKPHTFVLEDENGETQKVIKFKDAVIFDMLLAPEIEGHEGFRLNDLRKQPIRDHDILLCSYAKTGSHWLCNLIHFLLKEGPLETAVSYVPPLLELFPLQAVEKMPSPRVLLTHRRPASCPQEIFQKGGKVILLYRNPKDTVVSLFYHLRKFEVREKYKLSWSCHVDNWMKGLIPLDDFFDYYQSWQTFLEERKALNVLIICYEDMKTNGVRELRRISDYLGLQPSDERLEEVLNKCKLCNLKQDVDSGKVKSPLVTKEGKSILYRKGVIGDWKTHFTVDQNERMDAVIEEKTKGSIFKFKY